MGRMLDLVQFHFHTPSEHTFDGRRFSMEAHLVHKDMDTGGYLVLGVMIRHSKSAASNCCLRTALDYAPSPGSKARRHCWSRLARLRAALRTLAA
jgi:carbonic anhydrase